MNIQTLSEHTNQNNTVKKKGGGLRRVENRRPKEKIPVAVGTYNDKCKQDQTCVFQHFRGGH